LGSNDTRSGTREAVESGKQKAWLKAVYPIFEAVKRVFQQQCGRLLWRKGKKEREREPLPTEGGKKSWINSRMIKKRKRKKSGLGPRKKNSEDNMNRNNGIKNKYREKRHRIEEKQVIPACWEHKKPAERISKFG